MTETELGHLARHLGHDAKTHREFYRLSDKTVQLSKVFSNIHFVFCLLQTLFLRPHRLPSSLLILLVGKPED